MASDVSLQQPILAVPPDTCSSSANHCQPLPTYWDSTEAQLLFNPVPSEKNALESFNNQIKLLMITHDSPKGYLEVISCTGMESEEIDEEMSDYQRWLVQQKILVLTLALVQAKKYGMFEELGYML